MVPIQSMDYFGENNSRKMPRHLFSGAVYLNHESAIRGNPEKQNYSVCPRHWYIDADSKCSECGQTFTWTADEQKVWFEDYYFWIDSQPRHCQTCRTSRRHLVNLRKEYDSSVATAKNNGTIEQKLRIVELVSELESAIGRLPEKMLETKSLFERQIHREQKRLGKKD